MIKLDTWTNWKTMVVLMSGGRAGKVEYRQKLGTGVVEFKPLDPEVAAEYEVVDCMTKFLVRKPRPDTSTAVR